MGEAPSADLVLRRISELVCLLPPDDEIDNAATSEHQRMCVARERKKNIEQ